MPNIRFCGGPWHNRIEYVQLSPRVAIRRPDPIPCGITTLYKYDLYHLAEFHTYGYRTVYYQYVHSSLVRDGYADQSTYWERLPRWKLDRRKLERKLRRCGCVPVELAWRLETGWGAAGDCEGQQSLPPQ